MKWFVISLLAAHFISDWFLQSRKMAVEKSSDLDTLFRHILIIFYTIILVAWPFIGLTKAIELSWINMILHGIIDWNIWKFYKKKFSHLTKEQHMDNPWFYNTIAIDQFLHLSILFVLFL